MNGAGTDRLASATHFLTCISGPDQGKRLALTDGRLLVGSGAQCHLMSDDPDVSETFATMTFVNGRLEIQALTATLPFVDGHPVSHATLAPGQQVRFGRSVWQVAGAVSWTSGGSGVFDFVNRIGDQLSHAAGLEKPTDWDPRQMFAEVSKRRREDEIEEYFTVGTASTTPPLSAVDARWPRPWMFARVFLASLALYLGFVAAWREFGNVNLLPAIIIIGSFAMPFSLLVFFFEVNVARNISMYQVIRLLFIGGLLSLVVSLFGFRATNLTSWMGAASAGIIEEAGKGLTLLLVVNRPKFRWTLNGLLLGATVGAGFAIFESAGYALRALLVSSDAAVMRDLIVMRGMLAVFGGHVLWTGLVGAALWRVRGDRPFRMEMLVDPKFLRVFVFCVVMHMIWNTSAIRLPFYGKFVALGAVAWLLILGFIQDGLKQIRSAQSERRSGPVEAVA